MRAIEHITLDDGADLGAAPADTGPRATLRRHSIPGPGKDCHTELAILAGHYLRVRTAGPGGEMRDYQLDLRFADPASVRVRRLPWAWLAVATGATAAALAALAASWPVMIAALGWGLAAGLGLALTGAVAIQVCLRWTKESLQLRSVHGAAPLVSVGGPLGSTRRHEPVFADITRAAIAARLARPQDKPQFLRDEMREHYRLRQLGVLDDKDYDKAKAAILASH